MKRSKMNSLKRSKASRSLPVVAILCFLTTFSLFSQEYVNIRIKPLFKEAIESDSFLMDGNIGACSFKEEEYILSVGAAPLSGNSPNDLLNARTVAELLAHRQLAQFLYGVSIRSQSIIDEKVITEKTMKKVRGKATIDTLKKVEKVIQDIVIQDISQTLPGTETVGTWLSSDKNTSFVAIALKVNRKLSESK